MNVCIPFPSTQPKFTHANTLVQIFGHTGMKLLDNSAQWANYPGKSVRVSRATGDADQRSLLESAVWMVRYVTNIFGELTGNET